jgi:hypothetical protein
MLLIVGGAAVVAGGVSFGYRRRVIRGR